MRIMIDTNIIISLMLSPGGAVSTVIKSIVLKHTLCIPSFCLLEMEEVIQRKWPDKVKQIDRFLQTLPYDIIRTPDFYPELPHIRDENDRPVLAFAILAEVDILLTGDKDFSPVEIERPEIMTPAQFRETYL